MAAIMKNVRCPLSATVLRAHVNIEHMHYLRERYCQTRYHKAELWSHVDHNVHAYETLSCNTAHHSCHDHKWTVWTNRELVLETVELLHAIASLFRPTNFAISLYAMMEATL